MDIQWNMIWTYSNRAAAAGRKQDPFSDPLESAEWKDLEWVIGPLSKLISGRKNVSRIKQKKAQVERFTSPTTPNGVCVS